MAHAAPLLLGVAAGTLTWYCGFAALVALARRRVATRLLPTVDVCVGACLVFLGGLIGYRAVSHRPESV
jgi:hypothetical protein